MSNQVCNALESRGDLHAALLPGVRERPRVRENDARARRADLLREQVRLRRAGEDEPERCVQVLLDLSLEADQRRDGVRVLDRDDERDRALEQESVSAHGRYRSETSRTLMTLSNHAPNAPLALPCSSLRRAAICVLTLGPPEWPTETWSAASFWMSAPSSS